MEYTWPPVSSVEVLPAPHTEELRTASSRVKIPVITAKCLQPTSSEHEKLFYFIVGHKLRILARKNANTSKRKKNWNGTAIWVYLTFSDVNYLYETKWRPHSHLLGAITITKLKSLHLLLKDFRTSEQSPFWRISQKLLLLLKTSSIEIWRYCFMSKIVHHKIA